MSKMNAAVYTNGRGENYCVKCSLNFSVVNNLKNLSNNWARGKCPLNIFGLWDFNVKIHKFHCFRVNRQP
jgi:hypothetical protein